MISESKTIARLLLKASNQIIAIKMNRAVELEINEQDPYGRIPYEKFEFLDVKGIVHDYFDHQVKDYAPVGTLENEFLAQGAQFVLTGYNDDAFWEVFMEVIERDKKIKTPNSEIKRLANSNREPKTIKLIQRLIEDSSLEPKYRKDAEKAITYFAAGAALAEQKYGKAVAKFHNLRKKLEKALKEFYAKIPKDSNSDPYTVLVNVAVDTDKETVEISDALDEKSFSSVKP